MPYRDVIVALERAGCDPQGSGGQHKARCPAHQGDSKKLSVDLRGDRTLVKCWTRGCDFKSISVALRLSEGMFFETQRAEGGRYPASQRQEGDSVSKKTGFDSPTLEQIAIKSGVTVDYLRFLGWSEGTGECEKRNGSTYTVTGCRVPYFRRAFEGEEGSKELKGVEWRVIETFAKIRTSLEGDPKYVHERPGTPGLYGEWLLDKYRAKPKPVLIFGEGETCTAAATSQGLPFAGVPGVDLVAKVVKAEHIAGFERLFLVREPGSAGLKFCQNFAAHLPSIGWTGPVGVIELPKDSAELLRDKGSEGFLPAFRMATKAGVSLNRVSRDEEIKGLIQWGTEIKMKPVRFLMDPLIPIGYLTMLVGEAGLGKSYSMAAIGSKITKGEVLDSCKAESSEPGEGRVLVFSGEDRPDETLAPRFLACGGDLAKLAVYRIKKQAITFKDIDQLTRIVDYVRPALIFFDPLSSFWPEGVSMDKQETVKPLLQPLCDLGRRHNAGLVIVGWSPKGEVKSAMGMFFGSVAFRGTMRSGITVQPAPDDDEANSVRRGYISHAKGNLAARGGSVKYEITGDMFKLSPGQLAIMSEEEIEAVRRAGSFNWLGAVDVTADQAATGKSGRNATGTLRQAVAVMRRLLEAQPDGVPIGDVNTAMVKAGTMDHCWDARIELQVGERKGPGCQLLYLPADIDDDEQVEFSY